MNSCDPCDYAIFKTLAEGYETLTDESSLVYRSSCGPGGGSCASAMLVSPAPSEARQFHPDELREATLAINNILNAVRNNAPPNSELCFMRIPGKMMMLGWVEHDIETPADAITINSSPEEIMMAFGLSESYQSAA
jgi:hypothetical protein